MNKLWLIWKDENSNKKYHVGTLSKNYDTYQFEYSNKDKFRGLGEALDNGYSYLFPFKDLDKTYVSKNLFPTFMKRLPNRSRPDYVNLLERFGLKENATDMEILKITKGKTGVDSYEFISPLNVREHSLSSQFFIEGVRHYDLPSIQNAEAYFENNPKLKLKNHPVKEDSTAIQILSQDNHILGYMPAVYSKILTEIMKHVELELSMKDVNLDTLLPLSLYTHIEAKIPTSILSEFQNEFESISTESRV